MAHQDPPFFLISRNFFKFMSIESVRLSNQLILYWLLLLLPLIFPRLGVFTNESTLNIRWQNYWSFSISPSNEYLGLNFLFDWLIWSLCSPRDSQSFLQHQNLKASILQCSGFFMVQLSHLYMTTRKIRALTICIFVGFPGGTNGKEPDRQCRRLERQRFNRGSGRAPGGSHGNPLQYPCLWNHGQPWIGVTKSKTRLKQLSMHAPLSAK